MSILTVVFYKFKNLLLKSATESLFMFNGKYYRQTDGVAMGSPLGPTFANIFLCFYEQKWLDNCPKEFKPVLYRRYVDDIFLLFENEEHHLHFMNYMNSQHSSINFTDEKESNNEISFLDILIIRNPGDSTFSTSVYRKKTFSGVLTNWGSCIFIGHKIGTIYSMLHRCYMLCSNYESMHVQFEIVKGIFKQNGYPHYIIDACIMRFLNKIFDPSIQDKNVINDNNSKSIQIVLPYLGQFSLNVKRRLTDLLGKNLENCKLKLIFSSPKKLSNILNFKDRIPIGLSSCVIYKFTCGCCHASYVGKTKRHFRRRVGEHIGHSHLTGKKVKSPMVTSVSQHTQSSHHIAGWEDFEILGYEHSRNDVFLKIKESLLIKLHKPSLTNKTSEPLKLFS